LAGRWESLRFKPSEICSSVGAVQNAVRPLAVDFSEDTGHKVIFTVGSPAVVAQKIKDGETFDAVIVSEPAMDALDKEGIVNPESRVRLANTGIAVAVRAGAPVPNLSTQAGAAGGEVGSLRRSDAAQPERRKGRTDPRQCRASRRAQGQAPDRSRPSGEPGLDRQRRSGAGPV
jgi:hypothetical protein